MLLLQDCQRMSNFEILHLQFHTGCEGGEGVHVPVGQLGTDGAGGGRGEGQGLAGPVCKGMHAVQVLGE